MNQFSHRYRPEEYKVLSTFPRRDVRFFDPILSDPINLSTTFNIFTPFPAERPAWYIQPRSPQALSPGMLLLLLSLNIQKTRALYKTWWTVWCSICFSSLMNLNIQETLTLEAISSGDSDSEWNQVLHPNKAIWTQTFSPCPTSGLSCCSEW